MKRVLIILGILLMAWGIVRFVIGGSEDDWICVDGRWVKHGAPSALMPSEPCPLTKEQELVKKYIEENIVEISPVEAVLGGTWYVTDVEFLADDLVDVTYEDGHIMAWLEARYGFDDEGGVELSEIEVIDKEIEKLSHPTGDHPLGENKEIKGDASDDVDDGDKVCKDLCGDGECQEVVCMAVGCPCAETVESCPVDCE